MTKVLGAVSDAQQKINQIDDDNTLPEPTEWRPLSHHQQLSWSWSCKDVIFYEQKIGRVTLKSICYWDTKKGYLWACPAPQWQKLYHPLPNPCNHKQSPNCAPKLSELKAASKEVLIKFRWRLFMCKNTLSRFKRANQETKIRRKKYQKKRYRKKMKKGLEKDINLL